MMKLLILVLTVTSICTAAMPWSLCRGTDQSRLEVKTADSDPYPIQRGRLATFSMTGVAKTDIRQRNGRLDIYLGSTKIFSSAAAGEYSVDAKQQYNYSFGYNVPSFVPPGTYNVQVSMIDISTNLITCIQLDASF